MEAILKQEFAAMESDEAVRMAEKENRLNFSTVPGISQVASESHAQIARKKQIFQRARVGVMPSASATKERSAKLLTLT